jgi:lipopolysaccharide transport system permease protein
MTMLVFSLFFGKLAHMPVKWRPLYGLNPMAGVIEGFRWSLTGTGDPPSRMLLVSAAVVVAIVVTGMMYFQKMETTIADVV